jgi:hypothetical protein
VLVVVVVVGAVVVVGGGAVVVVVGAGHGPLEMTMATAVPGGTLAPPAGF